MGVATATKAEASDGLPSSAVIYATDGPVQMAVLAPITDLAARWARSAVAYVVGTGPLKIIEVVKADAVTQKSVPRQNNGAAG